MKLKIFENGPIAIDVEGEIAVECNGATESRSAPVFLCRCGLSADKPFCDGSHRKGKFEGVGAELDVASALHLNHVTLIVSDFERSVAFYRALGLRPVVHEPPRYARFVCPDGDATFSIEVTGEVPAPPRAQVFLECEELDATCERLRKAGVEFTQPPTDMPYLWREARLREPDGHDLRLYWAGRNRLDPPWKVSV